MKKRQIFLLILFFIFVLITGLVKVSLAGGTITGKQVSQSTNVSIFVNPALPILTIASPKNETYLKNTSILLDYTTSLSDNEWYNFDHGNNITISSAIYFNISQGSHTLYLFANNSQGTTTKNVTFVANLTRFIILYEEYKGSSKGSSTEFINYTYEEIQALSNVILENTNFGKIFFNKAINLTDDINPGDNILDLDNNTNISFNRIELNSTALPNFNVSAKIWLYNLEFDNPRILRNGEFCPSTICTNKDYTAGILSFNVSSFAVYSAEEIPSVAPVAGGGGAGTGVIKAISLDKEEIRVKLKQGESKKEKLVIKNVGNLKLKINLQNPILENFLNISTRNFELDPGQKKVIILNFNVGEDAIPDLYFGEIIIKIDKIKKVIPVTIEVESKKVLFDVKAEILKGLYVWPGQEIKVNIIIWEMDEKQRNVNLAYIIKDANGNEILSKQEIVPIKKQKTFLKTFEIPAETKQGKCVLYVKAVYKDSTASSSVWFTVTKKPLWLSIELIILIIVVILFITLIIIFKLKKQRAKFKGRKKKIKV